MAEPYPRPFLYPFGSLFKLKENLLLALAFADIRLYRLAMTFTHDTVKET